jgi:hypothetical protein
MELAQFCQPHSFYLSEANILKKEILSRSELRKFLANRSFYQPEFFCADTFEKISAWAVKVNQFPMLLKSDANMANSQNIFKLKAFRELPDFFEKINQNIEGNLVIEKFVTAKARLEVTFFNEKIALITQVGLEKSLNCRHAWRAFPLNLPQEYMRVIESFADSNADLISLKDVPQRITFAIVSGRLVPLSVNPGYNRLEYFPSWGNALRVEKTAGYFKTLNKLLFFYLTDEQLQKVNETELKTILAESLAELWIGNLSVIWLRTSNPQVIKDDSKKAAVFFNSISFANIE